MNHVKLSNKDWTCIEERFQNKLYSWKEKLLSVSRRLVLINSVLTSLAMFMVSFFEIPRGVLQKLDYYRSCFSGSVRSTKRNIVLLSGVFSVLAKILAV
jgi:hypothetical protein